MSAVHSPFPFPPAGNTGCIPIDEHSSRRDSIFDRTALVGSVTTGLGQDQQQQQQQSMLQNRLSKLGAERNTHNNSSGIPIGGGGGDTVAISSNTLLASSSKKQSSPVAFTSQVPTDAANIRPQPSKVEDLNDISASSVSNEKMLTLDTLQSALPDFSKEEVGVSRKKVSFYF